jgi:hypothetical protein
LGSEAKSAVPQLIDLAIRESSGLSPGPEIVGQALANIGTADEAAIPQLTQALYSGYLGEAAANMLTKLGPVTIPSLDAVVGKTVSFADGGGSRAQALATKVLTRIGPAAIPSLIRVATKFATELEESRRRLSVDSMRALGEMGPRAVEAIPTLTRIRNSVADDWLRVEIRQAAENALRQIQQ